MLIKFKQWGKEDNQTKISLFMKDLDPTKLYSAKEMKLYCEEKGLVNNLSNLLVHNTKKSNAFGKILQKVPGGYQLYPYLIDLFQQHF